MRRKQRHETRKALIVLDCTVETMVGLILLVTNVLGTLVQYKAAGFIAGFTVLMYAIPIPLAYLVNESRVRSTILAAGWIEGIKSIFYSSEKILNLEREELGENTPDTDFFNIQKKLGHNNPANPLPKFPIERKVENMCSDNTTDNHTLNRNTDNVKSSTNNIISRQDVSNDNSKSTFKTAKEHADFSDEYIEGNLPNRAMNHCKSNLNLELKEDEIVVSDIEYVNEEMMASTVTTATKHAPNISISRQGMSHNVPKVTFEKTKINVDSSDECIRSTLDCRNMKHCTSKLNKELKEDEIVVVDVEYVNEEMMESKETTATKHASNISISQQGMSHNVPKVTFEKTKMYVDSSDEYIEGNLPNHDINHSTSNQNVEIRENEIVVADIEYVNDEMVHSKETTATKRSPKSIIFRQDISNDISKFTLKTAKLSADSGDKYIKSNPDNCDMKQCKNKLDKELKENEIVVLDVELVNEEMILSKASASSNFSGTKRVAESKIFPFKLSSSIESAFQEKSGMVLRLLRDENFKSFSREYVLRRMLKGLDDNINEIQYRKYIEHLCYLEDYHQEQRKSCTVPELDFVVALLNAWYLSIWYLHGTTYQPGKVKISTSGKEPPADIKNNKNGRDQQRRRIIKHLLSCVSTDDQYRQYLKSLCIIERNCDQQDIPRCWDASAENDEKLIKPQQKCTIVKCFKR